MRSKLLPALILSSLLVACGPKAPRVDRCLVIGEPAEVLCANSKKKTYTLTPLQSDKYLCQDPTNYQLSKTYMLNLEKAAAKCEGKPKTPAVTDCTIDGKNIVLYCSAAGAAEFDVTWIDADKYLCLSPKDFALMQKYRSDLESDIANCSK